MEKLNTLSDFKDLKERLDAGREPDRPTIIIPAGTCGQASGANDLMRAAKRAILARELSEKIRLIITGCHGFCQMEPSVLVEPGRTFYPRVDTKGMAKIVEAMAQGKVVEELLFLDPATGKRIEKQDDMPFFKKQARTILARSERVDPIRLYHYIESGGYVSLAKVLEKRQRENLEKMAKTKELSQDKLDATSSQTILRKIKSFFGLG